MQGVAEAEYWRAVAERAYRAYGATMDRDKHPDYPRLAFRDVTRRYQDAWVEAVREVARAVGENPPKAGL